MLARAGFSRCDEGHQKEKNPAAVCVAGATEGGVRVQNSWQEGPLMHAGSFAVENAPSPAVQPGMRQQLVAWRKLLTQCGRKPGRKSVHALRVATLRLQAELEYGLREQPADTTGLNAARRLRRQGKKLRRALGPVRQADVYLGKLKRVRGWAGVEGNGHPAFPAECVTAIDRLTRSFERQRGDAANQLAAEIKRRRKRLGRLSTKAEPAFDAFAPGAESDASDKILDQIRAAADEFPELDAGNLHEFRKRIKKVRYLAEIFGRTDETAARQADTLRRMTGAVGEWHDWQALAAEARQAAGGRGSMKTLADCLEAQAGRSMEHALDLCRRSMRRLLREKTDGDRTEGPEPLSEVPHEAAERGNHKPAGRKPVASAPAAAERDEAEKPARAS